MNNLKIINGGYTINCAGVENQDACKSIVTNGQCPCLQDKEEKCEMDNTLLPAEVKQEAPTINLNQLQAEAEEKGLLLPTIFNRQTEPLQKQDESDLLLPCGIGG